MFATHFENMTISIVRPTEFVINPNYAELTAQCIISRDIFSFFSPTVCPGSSDPPEKIFNIFASENEVYTIY